MTEPVFGGRRGGLFSCRSTARRASHIPSFNGKSRVCPSSVCPWLVRVRTITINDHNHNQTPASRAHWQL